MATNPIQPQGFTPLPQTVPPAGGREAMPRAASVARTHGAAPARVPRPAEPIEVQLARIFARHAIQQQAQQAKVAEAPAPASGKIRGGRLDILA